MGIVSTIRGWWNNLFSKKDIEQALSIEVATSLVMLRAQEQWRLMYYGMAAWNNEKTPSKRTAAAIASEYARVAVVEFKSEITGSPRAVFLDTQYQKLINKIRFPRVVSQLAAGGELILKPTVNAVGGITIKVVENNQYVPIRYNDEDKLLEFATTQTIQRKTMFYTLVELNSYDEVKRKFTIIYTAYQASSPRTLGVKVSLSTIPEWAHLLDNYKFLDVNPWFVHLKIPLENDVEQSSRNGVSVYSKAVNSIKELDELGELTTHEFKAGRLKQIISSDLLDPATMLDDGSYNINHDLFQVINGHGGDTSPAFKETYNPTPRVEYYHQRKQELHREIEFLCQLSYGILSDAQAQDKTATEVKFSKERFYSANMATQEVLQEGLNETIEIMDEMATVYNLAPQGIYEASYNWGDSIMADRQAEGMERLQWQAAGVLSAEENRAWYTGEEEAEAAKNMPKGEEVI